MTALMGFLPDLGAQDTNNPLSGDYNFLIMPTHFRAIQSVFSNVDYSIGFAQKGGEQMCLAIGNSDNDATTDIYAKLYTDRVAGQAEGSKEIEITAWSDSSIRFTPRNGDINTSLPMLAMKNSCRAEQGRKNKKIFY